MMSPKSIFFAIVSAPILFGCGGQEPNYSILLLTSPSQIQHGVEHRAYVYDRPLEVEGIEATYKVETDFKNLNPDLIPQSREAVLAELQILSPEIDSFLSSLCLSQLKQINDIKVGERLKNQTVAVTYFNCKPF